MEQRASRIVSILMSISVPKRPLVLGLLATAYTKPYPTHPLRACGALLHYADSEIAGQQSCATVDVPSLTWLPSYGQYMSQQSSAYTLSFPTL